MRKIQKRNFLLAIIVSFVSLYILGSLGYIRPDIHAFRNSFIELLLFHVFFFSTSTFFLYQLSLTLSKRNKTKNMLLIFSCFLALVLLYLTFNPPFLSLSDAAVSAPYIIIGDFLRDQHGINWYYMDWGGWVITIVLYLFPMYTYFIYQFFLLLHFLRIIKLDPQVVS